MKITMRKPRGEGGVLGRFSVNTRVFNRMARLKVITQRDTQRIRETLLHDLQELFDLAKRYASDGRGSSHHRNQWAHTATYIGQVMNNLTKSFDEAQVTKDLAKLEKMLTEALSKGEM